MKKTIIILGIVMFLLTINSALAEIVQTDIGTTEKIQKTNVIQTFFGNLQQTVVASRQQAYYGDTITFDYTDTSLYTTNKLVFVWEIYKDGEIYKTPRGSPLSFTSEEISIQEGETYRASKTINIAETWFIEGNYELVMYMFDRERLRQASPGASKVFFSITPPTTRPGEEDPLGCKENYEGKCKGELGIYTDCKVSATGTSCDCDYIPCASGESCQSGVCVPSSRCVPEIYWDNICQYITQDTCGNTVTRANTEGKSCATNKICKDENCVANCREIFVGNLYCVGDSVRQFYQKSDCSTVERIRENCAEDEFCSAGECKIIETDADQELKDEQETVEDVEEGSNVELPQNELETIQDSFASDSKDIGATQELCVLDRECGVGYVCQGGECREQTADISFAIVLIVIILIISALIGFNIYQARTKRKKKRKR